MPNCPPITRPIRSSEPGFENEPLAEAEARRQCGANPGYPPSEDFRNWIVAARQQVEHDAQIVFYTGSFVWRFTDFPWGDAFEIPCIRPVTAISSITYIDSAGTAQTWSSSEYALDANGLRPIVKLNYGYTWPVNRGDINGITVTLVAGYSTVPLMPVRYKQAVTLKMRSLYLTAMGNDSRNDEAAYDRQIGLIGLEAVA